MRRERSCGIVVYRDGDEGGRSYLLLHYPGGHWDFPKGHMERGETEQETALREMREETGISKIRLDEGFRHIIRYRFRAADRRTVDKQVVFFCGRVEADELTLSHEHKGYTWLPFSNATDRVTFDNARKLLEKVEAYLGPANGQSSSESNEARAR